VLQIAREMALDRSEVDVPKLFDPGRSSAMEEGNPYSTMSAGHIARQSSTSGG
jgi:hypothetical protein